MLNIMRKVAMSDIAETEIKVGDRIEVALDGFGTFTATAHDIDEKTILFIFDKIVARHPMNETDTNEGGFKASALYKWLQKTLLLAFPDELRENIQELTIPTIGQIVGWNDEWDHNNMEPDGDEQLPLMKSRKHRIATFEEDGLMWYWVQNATKKDCSSANFAFVNYFGFTYYNGASNSYGVRPAFRLKKLESRGPVPRNKVSYKDYYSAKNENVLTSKESLLNEIKEKENNIVELRKQIAELERKRGYDTAACEAKMVVDSFVAAGFSEAQAIELITQIILGAMQ